MGSIKLKWTIAGKVEKMVLMERDSRTQVIKRGEVMGREDGKGKGWEGKTKQGCGGREN